MEPEIIAGASGVVGVGGFGLFMIKRWISKVDERLDRMIDDLHQIKIEMASRKGAVDGKDEVIWREVNSQKIHLAKMESRVDKAWETVSKIASPRISDLIERAIKDTK